VSTLYQATEDSDPLLHAVCADVSALVIQGIWRTFRASNCRR